MNDNNMMSEAHVTKKEENNQESTLVTVVIPTYNRAKFIAKGIESILKQTITNWKLLIVDDGSNDKTKKVVERYLSDPRIRYVKLKKNKGVCYALNHALSLVDTKYFSQLDADDWYEKNTLELCLKKMEKTNEKTAVVYGHEKVWMLEKGGRIKYLKAKKKQKINSNYDFITYHPMIYPRFYRTKALRKVNGWSNKVPQKGRYAEDRQILLKLADDHNFELVNTFLYNRLKHTSNNSRIGNRKKYASVTRYLYKEALKRWGDKYEAEFKWVGGRLKVGRLIKK